MVIRECLFKVKKLLLELICLRLSRFLKSDVSVFFVGVLGFL